MSLGTVPIDTLPPHVWALIMRGASLCQLIRVAHVSHRLHALLTGQARCTCRSAPSVADVLQSSSFTLAFWTEWRATRKPPGFFELYHYANRDCADGVHFALLAGADASVRDNGILEHAACRGYAHVVQRFLREPNVDPDGGENGAFCCACVNGHVDVVNLLLLDARVDPNRSPALNEACRQGHLAVVNRLLLEERLDVNLGDGSVLETACKHNHGQVVARLLLDSRIDPAAKPHRNSLDTACTYGAYEAVDALLCDSRVDPTLSNFVAMKSAAAANSEPIVKRLLQHPLLAENLACVDAALAVADSFVRPRIVALLERHRWELLKR